MTPVPPETVTSSCEVCPETIEAGTALAAAERAGAPAWVTVTTTGEIPVTVVVTFAIRAAASGFSA